MITTLIRISRLEAIMNDGVQTQAKGFGISRTQQVSCISRTRQVAAFHVSGRSPRYSQKTGYKATKEFIVISRAAFCAAPCRTRNMFRKLNCFLMEGDFYGLY